MERDLLDLRVHSLWSPFYFIKTVLGRAELTPGLHQAESDLFVQNLIAGRWRQFIEWPRGFFKTTTFTQGTGLWLVCPVSDEDTDYALTPEDRGGAGLPKAEWNDIAKLHDQNLLQLVAMEVDGNAIKKVSWLKSQFESNELFRALWPEISYRGDEEPWNASCIKIRRTDWRRHEQEGTFEAIGVGASLQSRHYDLVWEDDLVGEEATKSPALMEDTIGWHSRLAGAFVDASKQRRIGVSNRWGFNDLNSWVRAHEPDFIFHTRRAWEVDEATGQNIPTFPERYPMSALLDIKSHMHEVDFYCQYLNNPRAPGEKAIDMSKLHTYVVEEDGRMVCSCGAKFYLSQLQRYIHYDPSQMRNQRSKSKPCLSVVATASDRHVFLIDYFQAAKDYAGIYRAIVKYNDAYRPSKITYEDVGSQNMVEFYLRDLQNQESFRAEKHIRFPYIEPVGTKSKPKLVRIKEHFFPVIDTGKFSYRTKQTDFTSQLETFPFDVPGHDYDLLDTLAQGALVWKFPSTEDSARSAKAEEDEYTAQLGKPYSVMAT